MRPTSTYSKMADLRAPREGVATAAAASTAADALSSSQQAGHDADDAARPLRPDDVGLQRQPAGLGKLHEVDLGPDSTLRNIARTAQATRKLQSGEAAEPEPKLGPDGKPWRNRKRRTSEDIRRDKLVEEVLKETRLDIYDEPEAPLDTNDDQAADDRIAEKFRRDFLDALSTRANRRHAAPKKKKDNNAEQRPKGPKMGGSRSARAAMRAKELEAKKK
ncbi:hypothetical protein BDY21DRAFT_25390 [Lineolata rhizophorae]|uniref:Hepatocellular carcinoma-associated antigen 59-domain-containing protein n=1 Tax=Lineolata rhizophorae TaxID=578093 RepID=A0A6A6P0X8_9PEZI|nr:hypothetical protein BDY21DRAFT_25390 [Lineolata rhizophorae]